VVQSIVGMVIKPALSLSAEYNLLTEDQSAV